MNKAGSMTGHAATWPIRYQFVLAGKITADVLSAFPDLLIHRHTDSSVEFRGKIQDPTELRGLIARVDALDLVVSRMCRLPD